MHITAQRPRLWNDLYCVEWDVKLYNTIPYLHATLPLKCFLECLLTAPLPLTQFSAHSAPFFQSAHALPALHWQCIVTSGQSAALCRLPLEVTHASVLHTKPYWLFSYWVHITSEGTKVLHVIQQHLSKNTEWDNVYTHYTVRSTIQTNGHAWSRSIHATNLNNYVISLETEPRHVQSTIRHATYHGLIQ